jgi:hypothetical protein
MNDRYLKLASDYRLQLLAFSLFLLVNAVAPFTLGEVFPFTRSPRFSDQPTRYCEYTVYDENMNILPAEPYGLQQQYHGIPHGAGVGIRPQPTINRFGLVASEAEIRTHLVPLMKARSRETLLIEQRVIGAIDSQHVGVIPGQTRHWRIKVDDRQLD